MGFITDFFKTQLGAVICGIISGTIIYYSDPLLVLFNVPLIFYWTLIPILLSIIMFFIFSAIMRDDTLRKTNIRISFVATCYSIAALSLFVAVLLHSF